MAETIRALVVEDSELDYELLLANLGRDGFEVVSDRVEEEAEMRAALAGRRYDVVISDHNLPRFSSFAALAVLKSTGLDLPFLVVSGESGEELAVETMLAGADDYIMKGRLKRLAPALRRSLAAAGMRREKASAQAALAASEARLHELAAHLEMVKDSERTAIAREVHDDIGGSLTAIKFDLAWLKRRLPDDSEIQQRLAATSMMLDHAAEASQRIMRNLRPGVLDQGIVPALEWLTRSFRERTGINTSFDTNRSEVPVAEAVAMAVYRVCQEALTNITKHAEATQVGVTLFADGEQLTLEISDNGRGFGVDARLKPDSFGLTGMAERARALGGTLDIDSAPSRGTTLMFIVPIEAAGVSARWAVVTDRLKTLERPA
jgi:two-component system, NarL family, sensor histidine kinase UhpB